LLWGCGLDSFDQDTAEWQALLYVTMILMLPSTDTALAEMEWYSNIVRHPLKVFDE